MEKTLVVKFKNGQTIKFESEVEYLIGDPRLTEIVWDKVGDSQGHTSGGVENNIVSVHWEKKEEDKMRTVMKMLPWIVIVIIVVLIVLLATIATL